MNEFLDFYVMVNKVAEDKSDNFVIVVGGAPVSSSGYRFDRLCVGDLERLVQQLAAIDLVRDLQGSFRLDWNSSEEKGGRRDAQPPLERPAHRGRELTEIGRALFWLLFPDQSHVHLAFGRSCQCANRERKFLRLRLDLPPELANLPWELMEWPLNGHWAREINKAKISVVRYLGNIDGWEPSPGFPHVVVVKANPRKLSDNSRLTQSFDSECQRLVELFSRHSKFVKLRVIEKRATIRGFGNLIDQLEHDGNPVVGFHFIGHGGVDDNGGYLLWEDEHGNEEAIYEDQLRYALDGAKSLRWILFNACNTAHQPIGCPLAGLATSMAELRNVPTVIAYQRPVETNDAEILASELYKLVLVYGQDIDSALRSIQLRYRNPGGLMVLMRSVNGEILSTMPFINGQSQTASDADASAHQTGHPSDEDPKNRREERRQTDPERRSGDQQKSSPHEKAQKSSTRRHPSQESDLGEMVVVPAGPFKKGLSSEQIESLILQFKRHGLSIDLASAREVLSEEKEEKLVLPAFQIDITPVTNAQFRRFVESTGHITEAEKDRAPQNWRLYDQPDRAEHPVIFVSYNDALAYCDWAGKRLPTSNEWKKAYRGSEGRIYPWGDEFDVNLCNTAESQRGWETTPVTRFPMGRSPYGCYDMVGNVEEWASTPGPRETRVVLGGSWCMTCQVYGLPVLERYAATTFYSNEQGFRCAKDAPA